MQAGRQILFFGVEPPREGGREGGVKEAANLVRCSSLGDGGEASSKWNRSRRPSVAVVAAHTRTRTRTRTWP